MNKIYGNPKITAKRSRIFNGKNYRGQFSPMKNTTHINPKIYNNKQEMVMIDLDENCHAKRYQEEKEKYIITRMIKDMITWINYDFKYKKLYNQK